MAARYCRILSQIQIKLLYIVVGKNRSFFSPIESKNTFLLSFRLMNASSSYRSQTNSDDDDDNSSITNNRKEIHNARS